MGYVADDTDCDDSDDTINLDGIEVCDSVDNDCDGVIDPTSTWYRDDDADGYGDASTTSASCSQPAGYIADDTDCDDADADVNPAGTETCDSVDNDCDGSVDEGLICSVDENGDGYVDLCWTYPAGFYSADLNYDIWSSNASSFALSTTAYSDTEVCSGADSVRVASGDMFFVGIVWYPTATSSRQSTYANLGDTDGDGSDEFELYGEWTIDTLPVTNITPYTYSSYYSTYLYAYVEVP